MRFVDLASSVAVVTGGGSGIGRAIAHSFARRGARVAVSDLLTERADTVASEIEAAGGQAVAVACDVTSEDDLEHARDVTLDRFGGVDVVVNNVGVLVMGPPETIPLEAWQRLFDINVFGIVRSNRVFLPLLLEQGRGHVVNTASVSGLLAHGFDRLPYVTSKHAVVGMSESLAYYLRPQGVGVTCLCPSGVMTNIVEQITFYGPQTQPRTPDHQIVLPEVVGELVADAVDDGRFLVVTVPEVLDDLRDRAVDVEAFVSRSAPPPQPAPS